MTISPIPNGLIGLSTDTKPVTATAGGGATTTRAVTEASDTSSTATGLLTAANAGAANQSHTNNHSGTAVDAHSGTAVNAHSSHDTIDHKPPYFVVYIWKRTA